jgi:hypothetical protein
MKRLTPLVTGVLAVLLAGCTTAAIDQPTEPASASATSSPSSEANIPSPSLSQAATSGPDSLPWPPTDVTARSDASGKPGTMFTVHLSWTPAGADNAYRIYNYRTGEGPGFGKCVFDKATAEPLAVTQPGATSADVSLDEAETGAGVRCVFVVALNAAGGSAPTLAWRSSD